MERHEPAYDVVWPLGKSHWDTRELNTRVGDLNGKVVAEVWDRVFRGEEIFPAIRTALKRRYPDVRFVEYDQFGDTHGTTQKEVLAGLPALFAKHKVDAVISGVGA